MSHEDNDYQNTLKKYGIEKSFIYINDWMFHFADSKYIVDSLRSLLGINNKKNYFKIEEDKRMKFFLFCTSFLKKEEFMIVLQFFDSKDIYIKIEKMNLEDINET